ncbi:MAG: type II toxin-antitoxin system Phd/YefM family antitoxin [Desulfobacterales bacterium]|nr:type II toxin-antitoxin system Phd/YefM family antitoxin [Desulfobacterales bacterium]
MDTISVSEFKKHALRIFDNIAQTDGQIVVTKRGKPIAQINAYKKPSQKPTPDRLADTIIFEEDIVSPFGPDEWEATH